MTEAPLPRVSPTLIALFQAYLRHWYLPRHFSAVRLSGALPALPAGRPAVIYSNHPSWWDPTLFVILGAEHFPERAQYGPMDAVSLARYRFFARLGAFPVELGTRRGAADFLRLASEVLAKPNGLLWMTPEGAFTDPRVRPIRLKPGLSHLARRFPSALVLPLAIEYPFWNEPNPEALLRFGAPVRGDDFDGALQATMDGLAAAATTRDAGKFATLVDGTHGIAAASGLWRRPRPGRALR